MDTGLIIAVLSGISILLVLILVMRIPAFISLLIASIISGLIAGMNGREVVDTVQEGMGSTLGFVAVVVGLGAMFGAILEKSGGARAIAESLMRKMGIEKAPTSMLVTGFVVAIPVFFDVAFIILAPILFALQKRTGKSLLLYAIPLLSGLAITHAFIPPTPGPVAVADILGADLGWVIVMGIIAGIPTAWISGLLFGRYISKKIYVPLPEIAQEEETQVTKLPSATMIMVIIGIPIFLILLSTFTKSGVLPFREANFKQTIEFVGHPFTALILANLVAWYFLGIKRGYTAKELLNVTTRSMAPAGTIILLTGAGGVFKQVLVNSGAGTMLAEGLSNAGLPVIAFGFLAAVLMRVVQGSATVAMITSAGLTAPLLAAAGFTGPQLATLVIAIASGASIMSHVNDSGFWLVKQYLGMDEKQTLRSWTVMTTILALAGFLIAMVLFYIVS